MEGRLTVSEPSELGIQYTAPIFHVGRLAKERVQPHSEGKDFDKRQLVDIGHRLDACEEGRKGADVRGSGQCRLVEVRAVSSPLACQCRAKETA